MGQLLREQYPHDIILEEIPIPRERLILDFFVPSMLLAIECQGRQHDEYVPFFHGSLASFRKSRIRDQRKRQWCKLNDIELLLIPHDATDIAIRKILCGVK